ncbi:GNAT family N-acetyltransferase [Pedobacter cryophilus]|uniref:GNAT family N-acetyltransferase n=1 Tax=Pedobacter cryophilus TaxID=2571271 RepID=A0A4U1BWS7_9SPHI|nr:GNAT family N-acetyltransferase [Pedobacter cryophilus]TKB96771.1 GNAT family N-acetyltransferase [Pedobacter cryophilus]
MIISEYQRINQKEIIELLRYNTPKYFSPNEEKDLIYYLNHHAHHYYVLEVDQLIVGAGGFNLTDDKETAKISWDILHPQYQGKGFGTELTKFRIQKIKEIKSVKTISVRTSQLVYKFYEKFGLETKEIIKDFWDDGFDLYRMDSDINLISKH